MNLLKKIIRLLKKSKKELHIVDIAELLIKKNIWKTKGITPRNSVSSAITTYLSSTEKRKLIEKTKPSTYVYKPDKLICDINKQIKRLKGINNEFEFD